MRKGIPGWMRRYVSAGMSRQHLAVTMVLLLGGAALWGWPPGSRSPTNTTRRSPHAWDGTPPDSTYRVLRLEGDIRRPGLYVLAPEETLETVLREAGVPAEALHIYPEAIPSGTVCALRPASDEGWILYCREIPAVEKVILGLRPDINAVDADALASLPGIGSLRAAGIIEERYRRKGFRSLAELEAVPGIGAGISQRLGKYLSVGHGGQPQDEPPQEALSRPSAGGLW